MVDRIRPLVWILLFTLEYQLQITTANFITDGKFAISPKDLITFAFNGFNKYNTFKSLLVNRDPGHETQEILKNLDVTITDKVNNLNQNIQDLKFEIQDGFSKLDNKLTTKTNELFTLFSKVDKLYAKFDKIKNDTGAFFSKEIQNFVESAFLATDDVEDMHGLLKDTDVFNDGILTILSKKKNIDLMCLKKQSAQQYIFHLYNFIVEKETKMILIQLYAINLIETGTYVNDNSVNEYSKEKIEKWKQRTIGDLEKRITDTWKTVQESMKTASRELWKCDVFPDASDAYSTLPNYKPKNPTYSKIQVFQAYINFERDFSNNAKCVDTCETREDDTLNCQSPFCQQYNFEGKRCNGRLRNCRTFDHPAKLCYASKFSDRRYDWLETESHVKYGQVEKYCHYETYDIVNENIPAGQYIKPQTIFKGLFHNCGYCLCTCESSGNNVNRFFSLSVSTSDVKSNMVVTGVRLKNEDNIFYIQIQQGRLGANGTIIGPTDWKPIDKLDLNSKSCDFNSCPVYNVSSNQNTVYLDDIEPQPKSNDYEVVTGLRFKRVGNALMLAVQRKAFDYTTGQLKVQPYWYTNTPREIRTQVQMKGATIPTTRSNHLENSHSNQYIEFEITDMTKDLGQNTIPFIDIQDVETNPPMPISGAGIFHRASGDSGGFLALKLMHYDYTPHLTVN